MIEYISLSRLVSFDRFVPACNEDGDCPSTAECCLDGTCAQSIDDCGEELSALNNPPDACNRQRKVSLASNLLASTCSTVDVRSDIGNEGRAG